MVSTGTGKTHIALALGLAACLRGHRVRFITAAALVGELIEARDEKRLLRFQKQIAAIFSVAESYRKLGVPIRKYMADTLSGLADRSIHELDCLTPTAYAATIAK